MLAGLVACADASAPASIVRLLDAEPRYEVAPEPAPRRPLVEASALAAVDWWPVTWTLRGPSPERMALFEASTRVLDDGTLQLSEFGALMHVLEMGPEQDLLLLAEATSRHARMGLVEFTSLPSPDELETLPQLVSALEWARPGPERDGAMPISLFVRTSETTGAVGIVCGRTAPSDPHGGPTSFSDARLVRPGMLDFIEELGGERAGRDHPPRGRFTIAGTQRPGLVALPGARVALPLAAPRAPSRLELSFGLVPHAAFPPDTVVTLTGALHGATGDAAAEFHATLTTAPAGSSRWERIAVDLPPHLQGRGLALSVAVEASAPAACLPVIASARLRPQRPARPGPNVLVVSLDTLRADRLGCYGHARATSPNIDAFARGAVRFTHAWAQAPFTLPTHVSLFSGQFPSVHGVLSGDDRVDAGRTRLLATILADAGWSTAAFTGGGYVHPEFGFGDGFDRYGTLDPVLNLGSERVQGLIERIPGISQEMVAAAGIEAVTAWMTEHADESFLLFVHTYAPHTFDPPPAHLQALGLPERSDLAPETIRHHVEQLEQPPPQVLARLDELYDATVHHADAAVGELLATLERLDLAEDTIVVLTSDHGKELGEHGLVAHGHTLYEELLRVPLIVRVPGREPGVVDTPVMQVDVLPTILAALGLPMPNVAQGADLFSAPADRPLFAEVTDLAVKAALRHGAEKTIWSPLDADAYHANEREEESFDLSADPGERLPLPPDPERARRVAEFQAALAALGASLGGDGPAGGEMSAEVDAMLRELGYVTDR